MILGLIASLGQAAVAAAALQIVRILLLTN